MVGYNPDILRLQASQLDLNFPRYSINGKNLTTNKEEVKYAFSEAERISLETNNPNWLHISTSGFWNETLPNRISDSVISFAFHSHEINGQTVNLLDLQDCSGYFALRSAVKKRPSFIERITGAFNKKSAKGILPSFVSQGSIRLTTPPGGWGKVFTGTEGGNNPSTRLSKQVNYDIYLKTLRAPIVVGDIFAGNITAYLHLGNNRPENPKPELNGIIYAENSELLFHGGATEPFVMPKFAFNPDLSLFLQIGDKCSFKFEPAGAFLQRNSLYADVRFVPTGQQLFSPESIADPFAVSDMPAEKGDKAVLIDRKPFLDSRSPVFAIHADSFTFPADSAEGKW